MFVACAGDRVIGFADFCPVGPDLRWQLIAAGVTSGGLARHAPEALLRFGTIRAGATGVKRLYANLPLDSPLLDDARAVGFRPYAEEEIMVARALPQRHMPATIRPQEQADTWAIHQLYNAAVPRQVQYAEAYTSHFWDMDSRRGMTTDVRGWVLEDGHQVAGYLRIASRRERHVLDVVALPDRHDALATLLDGAAAFLAKRPVRRVYTALRTYQQHLVPAFEEIGFRKGSQQQLLVKYTTATVRAPLTEPVLAPVDARERVTKRVPTFMQTPRHEEPAPPNR